MRHPPVVHASAWHARCGRTIAPPGLRRRCRGSASPAAMATDQADAMHNRSLSPESSSNNQGIGSQASVPTFGQDGMPLTPGPRSRSSSSRKSRPGSSSSQASWPHQPTGQAHEHQNEAQSSAQVLGELVMAVLGPNAPAWSPRLQLTSTPMGRMPPTSKPEQVKTAPKCAVNLLAYNNRFEEALELMATWKAESKKKLLRVSHRSFMNSVAEHKQSKHVPAYLRLLPDRAVRDLRVYNLALSACEECQDLDTASAVMQLADSQGFTADTVLMTTYIKVCKSVGALDKAYATYMDIKRRGLTLDVVVVSTLLASMADTMRLDHNMAHKRKEQFLLMERAVSLATDAQDSGQKLTVACWNSLIVCAGRCGQLKRALEMLENLQLQGLRADSCTFGVLMEACMQNGRPDLALRLFEQAMHEGHVSEVQLYTKATSACCLPGHINWQRSLDIYSLLQRNNVVPDGKYYAALISAAGHAGHLDYALEVLTDMVGEGIRPSTPVCSAVIAACCRQGHHALARKVYDLSATQGVYPELSQFNRLMDWYASERRFGDVVSLLTDMTQQAQLQPNINTYRVLINACQRADQAALAFEVFGIMKANKVPLLQEKYAHTLYYTLIKSCLNMQRHILAQHNPHPAPWASGSRSWQPVVRLAEARQVLAALGSSLASRGASTLLLQDPDMNTWAQYALSSYRDMLARGWEPNACILDKLVSCLRLPGSVHLQYAVLTSKHSSSNSSGAARSTHLQSPSGHLPASASLHSTTLGGHLPHLGTQQGSDHSTRRGPEQEQESGHTDIDKKLLLSFKYQTAFERRAISLVEDAITRGHLPGFTVEQACTVDLRQLPPNLAEVYSLAVLTAFERRAARARSSAGADGGAAGDGNLFFHKFTLLVPPFQQDLVLWPSYVPKLVLDDKDVRDGSPGAFPGRQQAAGQGNPQVQHRYLGLSQQVVPVPGGEMDDDDDLPYTSHTRGAASPQQEPTTTGLAVAATLRRMKFFARTSAAQGVIILEPNEISSWVRAKRTWEMRLSGALNLEGAPQGATSLAQQMARQQSSVHQLQQQQSSSSSSPAFTGTVGGQVSAPGSRLRLNPADQQRQIRLGLRPDDLRPASALMPDPMGRDTPMELRHPHTQPPPTPPQTIVTSL